MKSITPDFTFESEYPGIVCGVDEAGRGPLAGPVVAAAVVLDRRVAPPVGLNDSKKLSPARRDALYLWITAHAPAHAVAVAEVAEIDRYNILHASLRAMARAVESLTPKAEVALVDGNVAPPLAASCRVRTIVRGDARSASIAAASILAKVTRDRLMLEMARTYPEYGFERHFGYGTTLHLEALRRFGPCPQHRSGFAPVRELLLQREKAACPALSL